MGVTVTRGGIPEERYWSLFDAILRGRVTGFEEKYFSPTSTAGEFRLSVFVSDYQHTPTDLQSLALAVLKGDSVAARALADRVVEEFNLEAEAHARGLPFRTRSELLEENERLVGDLGWVTLWLQEALGELNERDGDDDFYDDHDSHYDDPDYDT